MCEIQSPMDMDGCKLQSFSLQTYTVTQSLGSSKRHGSRQIIRATERTLALPAGDFLSAWL